MAERGRPSKERTAVARPGSGLSDPTLGGDADRDPGDSFSLGVVLAGRYRILELLGEGGMGAVYRARDLTLGTDVAVKLLAPELADDPSRVEYFRNEVLLARRVTHPNVCRLYDIAEHDGSWFITMEHVAGESLAERLRREGTLEPEAAMAVFREVAAGLAAAHRAGVVHRDLKPGNVLFASVGCMASCSTSFGPKPLRGRVRASVGGRAVIADFGIAVELNQLGGAVLDRAGTRGYMSPEQAAGGEIDARTDVFALGVLAYRMLTGELPLAAPTRVESTDLAPHVGRLPDDLSPRHAHLIERCLARDPAERPRDAGHVLAALDDDSPGPRRRNLLAAVPLLAALALAAASLAAPAGGAPLALRPPRQVVIDALDAGGLPAPQRWLGDAAAGRLAVEIEDAWGIPARRAAQPGPAPGAFDVEVGGALRRDAEGRLTLSLSVRHRGAASPARTEVAGGGIQELAEAAATAVVRASVPPGLRRPNDVDLETTGAHSARAWRLWRRAQRASVRQQWPLVRELALRAIELDPDFVAAHLENGWSYNGDDRARIPSFETAVATAARSRGLSPAWRAAIHFTRASIDGDTREMNRATQVIQTLVMPYRLEWYFRCRIFYAWYFGGRPADAIPQLEKLVETYPRLSGPAKLLANYWLGRDDPEAPELALRYARLATERAPDDVAARAELGRALLRGGDRAAAERLVALIESADHTEKQYAGAGGEATNSLFDLYMALGDVVGAERAERRLFTGPRQEQGHAAETSGLLAIYRGDRARGFADLEHALELYRSTDFVEFTSQALSNIAAISFALGDWARVERAIAEFPPPFRRPRHKVLAALAAYHRRGRRADLEAARRVVAEMRQGAGDRPFLESLVAATAGDWDAVVALEDQAVPGRHHIAAYFWLGEARERTGDLRRAAAWYEKLGTHRTAWEHPVWSARALLAAARLRAELGERDAAAALYRTYLARLDRAPPSHPGVARARAALRRLGASD